MSKNYEDYKSQVRFNDHVKTIVMPLILSLLFHSSTLRSNTGNNSSSKRGRTRILFGKPEEKQVGSKLSYSTASMVT